MVDKETGRITEETSLPPECLSLPLVCQEGVRDFLASLRKMGEEESWFRVRTPEELNAIIPQIQTTAQEFMDALRPFKKGGMTWGAALNVAGRRATLAARNATQGAAWNAALNAARDVTLDTGMNAAGDVVLGAAWETIKDQPSFGENPFLKLLELYQLGSTGFEFRKVDETQKLVVHFPLPFQTIRRERVLACLVFGDAEPGDQKVLYVHGWNQDCSVIRLLNPRQISRH